MQHETVMINGRGGRWRTVVFRMHAMQTGVRRRPSKGETDAGARNWLGGILLIHNPGRKSHTRLPLSHTLSLVERQRWQEEPRTESGQKGGRRRRKRREVGGPGGGGAGGEEDRGGRSLGGEARGERRGRGLRKALTQRACTGTRMRDSAAPAPALW